MRRKKMSVRDSYVAAFGEEQACNLERAAEMHKNGIHDKPGSDAFKWACLIAIGHECISRPRFAEYHEITVPQDDFKKWCLEHGELGSHDGEVDYISLMLGIYNEYIIRRFIFHWS
jgi:hypothetical protein